MIKYILLILGLILSSCASRLKDNALLGEVAEDKKVAQIRRNIDYFVDKTPLRLYIDIKKVTDSSYDLILTIRNTTERDLIFNIPSGFFWGNYFLLREVKTRKNLNRRINFLTKEELKKFQKVRLVKIKGTKNSKKGDNYRQLKINMSLETVIDKGKKVKVLNCGRISFFIPEKPNTLYEFQVIFSGLMDAKLQEQEILKQDINILWQGEAISNQKLLKF